MDLHDIKGRIAVALVESIFRRAGFTLSPVETPIGRRELVTRLGREDLIPDFSAVRSAAAASAVPPETPNRPRVVDVRYRPQVAQYVSIEEERGPRGLFALAKRQWPALVFIFVTDHPEPGRSSFQAVDLEPWSLGTAVSAVDLFAHQGLAIYRQNVEEHESLLRRMFALLTGSA